MPNVMQAMQAEHLRGCEADLEFTTGNVRAHACAHACALVPVILQSCMCLVLLRLCLSLRE